MKLSIDTIKKSVVIICLLLTYQLHAQRLTVVVVGTGYVGLVTGAGLASLGHRVICADVDENKITQIQKGIVPFYEAGLSELIAEGVQQENLFFTSTVSSVLTQADVILISVGTPMSESGSADVSAIHAVVKTIASVINKPTVICIKSTVPVGTGQLVKIQLQQAGIAPHLYSVVSNPEFLREGNALYDFFNPERIVIGFEDAWARDLMCHLYEPFIEQKVPFVFTNLATSELSKYASNAFLATKISFINEIAHLCDATGADVSVIAHIMGLDSRIGSSFLAPGPGFGGSCFPKDSQALLYMAQQAQLPLHIVSALLIVNDAQKHVPVKKLQVLCDGDISQKTIAVLGLSFKAHTDDIRYAPALTIIQDLLDAGAKVQAYDPVANNNMKRVFPQVCYCNHAYEALLQCDGALIVTEWPEFKQLDLKKAQSYMKHPVIVDCRNILDRDQLEAAHYMYDTIGRGSNK